MKAQSSKAKNGVVEREGGHVSVSATGGHRLADIIRPFGLSNIGSVSFITTQIRKRIKENIEFSHTIQCVKRYIIKHEY